jgi:hypothetical protein
MIGSLQLETVLASVYAVVLLLIAAGLEWVARHSHRRTDQYHTAGFRFHRDRDAWECPMGIALMRAEIDHEQNVVRYRAPAHTCNSCAIKSRCTHSDQGREILVQLDPWVQSAPLRLQRGISVVLHTLAAFILTVELLRHRQPADEMVAGAILLVVLVRLLVSSRSAIELGQRNPLRSRHFD